MIDEEKQMIDEMAREIAKRDCYLYEKCPKPIKHNCVSQDPAIMMESSKNYITIATWLVRAGYRKERQGEWKRVEVNLGDGVKTYKFACTNCGFQKKTLNGNFCPNCGAKMRGE